MESNADSYLKHVLACNKNVLNILIFINNIVSYIYAYNQERRRVAERVLVKFLEGL